MISSAKNPRIIEVRKLSQRKYRQRQNRFLVEGLQLLGLAAEMMAHTDRVHPIDVFYSEPLFTGPTAPRLLNHFARTGASLTHVAPPVLNSISERELSQGLAVTFALNQLLYSVDTLTGLTPPRLILVLDRLQDPGNLGTLIRTADAVGASGLILLEPSVDPFDPKTVRGTMGSIFTVPFARVASVADLLSPLTRGGYRLVGADAARGKTVWHGTTLSGPVALVLGNEARGLSPDLEQHISGFVSLPITGHAESLNVSVAGGILMYEWLRANGSENEKTTDDVLQ
jgi:TrmH family RNA methyltransferase